METVSETIQDIAQKKVRGKRRDTFCSGRNLSTQKYTYFPVVTFQNCVEFIFGHILIWKCYDYGRDIEVKSVGSHNFGKHIISDL